MVPKGPTKGQGHLLSCSGQLKNLKPEIKQELPIWRRRERGEVEERTGKNLLEGEVQFNFTFLAVQNSSIGDLVTDSVSHSVTVLLLLTLKSHPRDL